MRIADFVITAALVVGVSGTALAQNSNNSNNTSGFDPEGHWFASAYLGSNFGGPNSTVQNLANLTNNSDIDTGSNASINFGGEVGYVFNGAYGAEFMANYSPNFELGNVLLVRRPGLATYMVNGIAAIPIHLGDTRFRPFVSGGVGAVQLRSEIFTIDPTTNPNVNTIGTTTENGSRFGWDLGGGLMIFNGAWGLRGDVRYYKATTENNISDTTIGGLFLHQELSGLSFWNANFGVAFRW
jgi:hypothetical protein